MPPLPLEVRGQLALKLKPSVGVEVRGGGSRVGTIAWKPLSLALPSPQQPPISLLKHHIVAVLQLLVVLLLTMVV